jgi:hypothetical protein
MYLALSLALPVLWVAALWLAGAYDVRFIGTGSDEFRKVLNAGIGLTAAVAIFSYAINLELSRAYVVIGLPASRCSTCWSGLPCGSGWSGSACTASACTAW